jgi:hypothetical protein
MNVHIDIRGMAPINDVGVIESLRSRVTAFVAAAAEDGITLRADFSPAFPPEPEVTLPVAPPVATPAAHLATGKGPHKLPEREPETRHH